MSRRPGRRPRHHTAYRTPLAISGRANIESDAAQGEIAAGTAIVDDSHVLKLRVAVGRIAQMMTGGRQFLT